MKKNTINKCVVKVCLANCVHSTAYKDPTSVKTQPTCTLDEVTLNKYFQCEMFKDAKYLSYLQR